ncbi:phosphoenolpyruvate--protein phosphotransferase [Metaclostridioides mangenotii]|uniref:phosphoenolpyruvate--protein phosphotransferase n=1 Tax=Metaclostridioides mangenotii TaxID=1540 RepID=UPI0004678003|nr:phosphoenolpyruvate--protein phosphotransferase [Clostridioides mangenotii]
MFLNGIGASPGIAMGKALVVVDNKPIIEKRTIDNVDYEIERLDRAVEISRKEMDGLKNKAIKVLPYGEAELVVEHLSILDNSDLIISTKERIEKEKVNAEYALNEAKELFVTMFESMGNIYTSERAFDIKSITERLIKHLLGLEVIDISLLEEDTILVSDKFTINDFNLINVDTVVGSLTDLGTKASFSAIISRGIEIPSVVGLNDITQKVKNGDFIVFDGRSGEVIVNPDEEIKTEYIEYRKKYCKEREMLNKLKGKKTVTLDGKEISLYGNMSTQIEMDNIIKNDAEGIGLLRTEFLYLNRDTSPSENQQYEVYKSIIEKMDGKPIVIRTLDIGADEELSYINLKEELNPSLGYRSIRLCLDRLDIFKTQLRALYRASVYGKLKIEFPMISCLAELIEVKSILKETLDKLDKDGIKYNKNVEIGAVIEVPSLAIISDIIVKHVDFLSVDIDDLIQFTLAVDRSNHRLNDIYEKFNPGVLRLLRHVLESAKNKNKWVGICGEPCGDLKMVPLLLAIGFEKLSMPPIAILNIRHLISSINTQDLQELKDKVFSMETSREISNLLDKYLEESFSI